MIYPINHLPGDIPVGVQTEQGVEVIGFDLKPWLDALPDMSFSVWHTRPGEKEAYPAKDQMMAGTVLYWHPDGYDTAIAGDGKVEIAGVGDNKRKLSGFVATSIRATSLGATKEPGENFPPWYEAVLQAAQDVKVDVNVGIGGLFLVNAQNGKSDRSQDEIRAAVAAGKTCMLTDNAGRVYTYYEEGTDYTQSPPEANCPIFTSRFGVQNTAIFAWEAIVRADGSVRVGSSSNVKTLTIKRGDTTTTYNGSKDASMEVPDVFIVTVTGNKASHTQDEIRAAASAGKACLMIWNDNVYTYAGEKVAAGENCPSFDAGMKNSPDGLTGLYYQHVCVTSDGGCVTLGTAAPARTVRALYIKERGSSSYTTYDGSEARNIEIPVTLPNPNALTIGGVAYDGSKAVAVMPAPSDASSTAYLRWNGTKYAPATIDQLKKDLGLT